MEAVRQAAGITHTTGYITQWKLRISSNVFPIVVGDDGRDEEETKKRRGGRGVWCERRAWLKSERGARRACGATMEEMRKRPRRGVVGVVGEGFGAKEERALSLRGYNSAVFTSIIL